MIDIEQMEDFNLESAMRGNPVCTRGGRRAEIVCAGSKDEQPVVARIESHYDGGDGIIQRYYKDGRVYKCKRDFNDLMMYVEWELEE